MDEEPRTAGPELGAEERSAQELRDDIERTRSELGDTVEALAEKTDVKARAKERVAGVQATLRARRDAATAKVRSTTPATAQQGGRQVAARVRENPAPAAISGAAIAGFVLGRMTARGRS